MDSNEPTEMNDVEGPYLAVTGEPATVQDRPRITRGDIDELPWDCWIPPRGPQDFDHDAVLAPFGDTHWRTHAEACEFVEQVLANYPHVAA